MYHGQSGAGQVAANSRSFRFRPTPASNTGSSVYIAGSSINDGTHIGCGTLAVPYTSGFNEVFISLTCTSVGACWLTRIEILFVDGYAPSGALTDDDNLCT